MDIGKPQKIRKSKKQFDDLPSIKVEPKPIPVELPKPQEVEKPQEVGNANSGSLRIPV